MLQITWQEYMKVDTTSLSGLTLKNLLAWSDYTTETCNKVFAGIHSLKRFVLYLPLNIKVMLVKTLIFPHFNYCDVVNEMTGELSDRLQHAQNYCIDFIFNLKRQHHIKPFWNYLFILKLNQLRQLHVLTSLLCILPNHSPVYLSEWFYFWKQHLAQSFFINYIYS